MTSLIVGQMYIVDENFIAESDTELNCTQGEKVTVLEPEDPNNPGWVFCSKGGLEGYVPSDFLVSDAMPKTSLPPPPPAIGGTSGAPPPAAAYMPATNDAPLFPDTTPSYNASVPPPAFNAPAPTSYNTGPSIAEQADRLAQEEKFKAEQRVISLELWAYREELLGTLVAPDPPARTWFYKDFFGDDQGPFNMPEMKERLGNGYVTDQSVVLLDTGVGDLNKQEQENLRDLFRSPEEAFVVGPRPTKSHSRCWFYLDRNGKEVGPFNNPQMKEWFDAGFFSGSSLVRLANGKSNLTPLKDVYPDPNNTFHAPPDLPNPDLTAFVGHRTAVLIRDPGMGKKKIEEPQTQETEKVTFEVAAPPPPPPPPSSTGQPAPPPPPVPQPSASKPPPYIYGGPYAPYTGIPTPEMKKYNSNLYTFVTRPLHPDAGVVQMYIRRDIDGSHINFNKYIVYLEGTNVPILAAFRHHHNNLNNYYDIKLNTSGKKTDNARGLTVSNLELNFVGTQFLLHSDVPGHQGTPKDLACVTYERNRVSNKGPRKMKIGLPQVENREFVTWKHDSSSTKNSNMIQALKAISSKDLIPLLNKPPKWNEKKRAYMLDFKGRVTRSSVKNFQLVDGLRDPSHSHVILQHGRTGVNKFTMDVQHPMSILQAFAISLSSLHSKKSVD